MFVPLKSSIHPSTKRETNQVTMTSLPLLFTPNVSRTSLSARKSVISSVFTELPSECGRIRDNSTCQHTGTAHGLFSTLRMLHTTPSHGTANVQPSRSTRTSSFHLFVNGLRNTSQATMELPRTFTKAFQVHQRPKVILMSLLKSFQSTKWTNTPTNLN